MGGALPSSEPNPSLALNCSLGVTCGVASLQFLGRGTHRGLCGWGGGGTLRRSARGGDRDGVRCPGCHLPFLCARGLVPGASAQVTPGTPSSLRPLGAQLLRGAGQGPPQGPRVAAPSRTRARISWAPCLPCPSPSVPLPCPRPLSGLGHPSAHTSCLPHSAHEGPSRRAQGLRLASEQEGGGPLPGDQALKGWPPPGQGPPPRVDKLTRSDTAGTDRRDAEAFVARSLNPASDQLSLEVPGRALG